MACRMQSGSNKCDARCREAGQSSVATCSVVASCYSLPTPARCSTLRHSSSGQLERAHLQPVLPHRHLDVQLAEGSGPVGPVLNLQ